MRDRFMDLAAVLESPRALRETGIAVLGHESLPHPVLKLMECLYPGEVCWARFRALRAERGAATPDPLVIGAQFNSELAAALEIPAPTGHHSP
jgi:hypothetical protein